MKTESRAQGKFLIKANQTSSYTHQTRVAACATSLETAGHPDGQNSTDSGCRVPKPGSSSPHRHRPGAQRLGSALIRGASARRPTMSPSCPSRLGAGAPSHLLLCPRRPPRPSAMIARQEAALSRTQSPFSRSGQFTEQRQGRGCRMAAFFGRFATLTAGARARLPRPTHWDPRRAGRWHLLQSRTLHRVGQAGAPVQGTSFQKFQKTRYTRTSTYRVRTTL